MDSLLNNLAEFIGVLRLSGVRVSTLEAMDAAGALLHADIGKERQELIASRNNQIQRARREIEEQAEDLRFQGEPPALTEEQKEVTLEADAAAEQLRELGKRVRKILRLNPIPEKEWDRVPALGEFAKNSTMPDCSTLEKLASACTRLGAGLRTIEFISQSLENCLRLQYKSHDCAATNNLPDDWN